nr:unnamed protein product [Digitaria exilis]
MGWGAEIARLVALAVVDTDMETESPPPMRREGTTASMVGAAVCGARTSGWGRNRGELAAGVAVAYPPAG